LVVLVSLIPVYSQANHNNLIEVKLDSKIMGEVRTIIVSLPNGYENEGNQRYPVQYILDGRANIEHTRATSNFLSEFSEMPQTIIVGITNENRVRDMTPSVDLSRNKDSGNANRFLDFIEVEVIKYIEANYRTASYRTIAGHSLGGLAVTHSFIRKPELYDAYFVFSGTFTWNDGEHLTRLEQSLKMNQSKNAFFYMNMGNEKRKAKPMFLKTKTLFEKGGGPKLAFHSAIYPQETHGTTPLKGQLEVYRILFGGWRLDKYEVEKDTAYIEKFIQKQSTKYGFDVIVTESIFYQLTNYFIRKKMFKEALEVSKIRLKYYPSSHYAFRSMADAEFASGDTPSAIQNINKAISIAKKSNHENLNRYIEKLKSYSKK